MNIAYEKGLHELGDGLFAYLQPDGSWGWSNAGLITAGGISLLVDTLFDLRLAREMLDSMRPLTDENPISAALNTHGDPDHCFGNQLLPDSAELYSTSAAAERLRASPPAVVAGLMSSDLGPEFSFFARERFSAFHLDDIELRVPSSTFEGRLELQVGDRAVHLVELGPAHSPGDAIAYVPDADVVFTGDLLFVGGTPMIWEGPVENWLAACDRILELDARVLVPGHGPVTDASGVRDVKRYLAYIRDEARARFDAGLEADEAADDIDLSDFSDWGEPERIAANVAVLYREFDEGRPRELVPELFVRMAQWASRH